MMTKKYNSKCIVSFEAMPEYAIKNLFYFEGTQPHKGKVKYKSGFYSTYYKDRLKNYNRFSDYFYMFGDPYRHTVDNKRQFIRNKQLWNKAKITVKLTDGQKFTHYFEDNSQLNRYLNREFGGGMWIDA